MSATNRKKRDGTKTKRSDRDFYETPEWVVRAIAPFIPPSGGGACILDAGSGTGRIAFTLCKYFGLKVSMRCIEISPELCAHTEGAIDTINADYLDPNNGIEALGVATVVSNPPFSKALEFVERSIDLVGRSGSVFMLQQLTWMSSLSRVWFHREHPSDVLVIPRRPSFRIGGGTDQAEYAWFAWGPGRGGRWSILDVEQASRKRRLVK